MEAGHPIRRVLRAARRSFWWWYLPLTTVIFAWVSIFEDQTNGVTRIIILGAFGILGMLDAASAARRKVQTRYNKLVHENIRLNHELAHERWSNDLLRIRLDENYGKR